MCPLRGHDQCRPQGLNVKGFHTFKKDYKSQTSKCSLLEAEVQPYPTLKKMVDSMCRKQITTTPYANKTYHPKPKKTLKKRNLVQLTTPDRSKLVKPRKINMQKFSSSTISQLNWKSTTGRSLTQETIKVAFSMLTNLVPMQRSQLEDNTSSLP